MTTTTPEPNTAKRTTTPRTPVLMVESALASSGALTLSNPFEVAKTRMQLQGAGVRREAERVVYRSCPHAVWRIRHEEGFRALYNGLPAAATHQVAMNGVRFGTYQPTKERLEAALGGGKSIGASVAAAFSVGVAGSFIGTPFFLAKTRLQVMNTSTTSAAADKVGHQHQYRGMLDCFRQIFRQSGVHGLFQGGVSCMLRTGVGSAAQLPVYDLVKETGVQRFGFCANAIPLHVVCSACAATNIVLFMSPFDAVNVRCFNAPRAARASVPRMLLDIVKIEGVRGLYKGAGALWWRTAPHSTGTFVLLEQIRQRRGETSAVLFPSLFEMTD